MQRLFVEVDIYLVIWLTYIYICTCIYTYVDVNSYTQICMYTNLQDVDTTKLSAIVELSAWCLTPLHRPAHVHFACYHAHFLSVDLPLAWEDSRFLHTHIFLYTVGASVLMSIANANSALMYSVYLMYISCSGWFIRVRSVSSEIRRRTSLSLSCTVRHNRTYSGHGGSRTWYILCADVAVAEVQGKRCILCILVLVISVNSISIVQIILHKFVHNTYVYTPATFSPLPC